MICEKCRKEMIVTLVDKVLAEREIAIKRMNERNNYASKSKDN